MVKKAIGLDGHVKVLALLTDLTHSVSVAGSKATALRNSGFATSVYGIENKRITEVTKLLTAALTEIELLSQNVAGKIAKSRA